MTKFFAFCSFIFFYSICNAQNLVPNPSFEEYENGCPESFNEMPSNWVWWRGSPNSFHTCIEPETLSDSLGWAPNTGFGFQVPSDGESFIGLACHGQSDAPNTREYIGIELLEPLIEGEEYFVSLKVSLAMPTYYFQFNWACSHFGVLFTNQTYVWKLDELEIPNYAHIYDESVITDTVGWYEITGNFVADQNYAYMGIGVFFDENIIDTLQINGNQGLGVYYFIDDVCVSQSSDCDGHSTINEENDTGEFNIDSNNDELIIHSNSSNYSVNIFNINGQLVYEKFGLSQNTAITLKSLNSGIYLIKVKSYNRAFAKKFVKV